MSILIVHCSCAADGSAAGIARSLVEERLAACVSVLPGMRSTFRWRGETHTDDEVLLLIKTTREAYPALAARLLELHPYELPEIIAVDVSAAHAPYAAWVAEQTTQS
ncbi:MAG TPA: divalent-cation tolerance protein CutA [Dokdonella sp.]|jgi:periplasmic divalent cation tolerance protein|nr:divalent-cation tolerance protein CutA [Dokdonella sp.]